MHNTYKYVHYTITLENNSSLSENAFEGVINDPISSSKYFLMRFKTHKTKQYVGWKLLDGSWGPNICCQNNIE